MKRARLCSGVAAILTILALGEPLVAASPPRHPTIRRVWVGPERADFGDIWAVSSDGRFLAYRDAQSRIGVYDLRGRRTRILPVELPNQQGRVAFAWSADGSRLAFNRRAQNGEQLEVVGNRTRRTRVIARFDGPIVPIGWSADHTRIAVTIERGTTVDLAWVSVDGGSAQRIARVGNAIRIGRSFSAVLSPDSRQIAFTRFTNGRTRDIFVIREDGTHETPVVEHPADDYPIGYTKDMRQLLFASDRSATIDLWSTPISPADKRPIPTRLRRDLGVILPMGITHGGALYYVLSQCSADVLTATLGSPPGVAPSSIKPVATRFVGYNSGPDWAPSGEELVYQVGEPGSPDGISLVFLSLSTGEERSVHPALLQFSRPRYASDGESVVVHGVASDGVQGIYRIDGRSGAATRLARGDPEEVLNPAWAARGEILFFERGGNSVSMLDRTGQREIQVYKAGAWNANFNSAPSPDGRSVAIVDGPSLRVVSVGNSEREILSVAPPDMLHPFPGSLAWTADGRFILFGKVAGRAREVWRVPAAGGQPEPTGLSVQDQSLYFLRTSADGRRIAFVVGDCDLRPRELWSMENFIADTIR